MWNPITNKVYESKDVVFLQWMFYVKLDGSFSVIVRMIPEVEGVENTDDNEDDLDEEEMVEEAEIKKEGGDNGTSDIPVDTENDESIPEIGTIDTPTDTENTEMVQEKMEEDPVGTVTRTGGSIIKPMKFVEQCNLSGEDIGYKKLLGLLSGTSMLVEKYVQKGLV